MRKIYLLAIVSFAYIIINCAHTPPSSPPSNSGHSNKNSKILIVSGIVQFPDGKSVAGATVTSLPPSEKVFSREDGSFIISTGLQPNLYNFIAEYEGAKGNTRASVQYGDTVKVLIRLGSTIDMRTYNPGKTRRPSGGSEDPYVSKP